MAEPIATSVMSSLPRHIVGKGRPVRVAKIASRPSFSENFFTPIPRHMPSLVDSPPLESVLKHRAWEYPSSKHSLWREDGLMRSLLLAEIFPPLVNGRRIRRTSQASRTRLRKPIYSSASTTRLNFSTSPSVDESQLQHRPLVPIALQSRAIFDSPVDAFRDLIRHRAKSKLDLQQALYLFTSAKSQNAFQLMVPEEIVSLAEDLADFIDHLCMDRVDVEVITNWGQRLRELLEHIPSGSNSVTLGDLPRMSLITRASAFVGHFHQAQEFFSRVPNETAPRKWNDPPDAYQKVFESMVLSMQRHEGLYTAMYFMFFKNKWFTTSMASSRFLRGMVVENPDSIKEVLSLATKWKTSTYERMVQEIILAFNDAKLVNKSLEIINYQYAVGLKVPTHPMLHTVRMLVSRGKIDDAQKLFDLVPVGTEEEYESVKNFLSSRAETYKQANEVALGHLYGVELADQQISAALHALARKGNLESVCTEFDTFFPKDAEGKRVRKPNVYHYTLIVLAHAKKGVSEGLNGWLEDMKENEVQPNLHTMTNILGLYRKKNDLVNVLDTYQYMRKIGMELDSMVYTVVISALAAAKDSENAARIYMQAIDNGLVPDDKMSLSLLNAYVETGSFKEAIALFHHLTSLPTDRLPIIDTFNTLLKGYVLFGAPFRLISKLFARLQALKIEPDAYTFSILVLSATDAGRMDLAYDIYEEMKSLEASGQQSNLITIYVLDILMTAHLKRREYEEANKIMEEMTARGCPPDAISYRAIVHSYTNVRKDNREESVKLAEDLVKRIQGEGTLERQSKRNLRMSSYYMPLITHYASKGDITQVERVYSEYLDEGGEPTVILFQQLLRCYGLVDDTKNAMAVWGLIMELAKHREIDGGFADGDVIKTRSANIQFELSVYIDLLSRKGLHSQVASTWADLQSHGFEFDSHNWNHLVVALIRAGQVERAFEFVETILIPRWKENEAAIEALKSESEALKAENDALASKDGSDTSKAASDLEKKLNIGADIQAPPNKPPLRDKKIRMKASRNRKLNARWLWELVEDDRAIDADFSYPMRILQIIPPKWHTWRPHKVVFRTLLVVLLQLQRGYPIRPLLPDEKAFSNVSESVTTVQDSQATESLLLTLYTKYPLTSAEMRHFHVREAMRLTPELFERIYRRR